MPNNHAPSNERRRLLVITYHYPPDGSVGGLRWGGLSKNLAREWEVHVITAAPQPSAQTGVPGLYVHYCAPSATLNDVYNRFAEGARRLLRRERAQPPVAGAQPSAQPSVPPSTQPSATSQESGPPRTSALGWLRTNVSALLAFPDWGRGWIVPAARLAHRLMREMPFDAVVSSGPPHSAHVAATLACVGNPRLLTVDMRDPWAALIDKAWSHPVYSSAATRGMVRRFERTILHRARGVVANTREFAAELAMTYPRIRVAYVSNGIDVDRLPSRDTPRFEGLSIAYAGTLYLSRDLTPVVRAMKVFLHAHPGARGQLKLRIAGTMEAASEARLRSEIAAAGVEDAVEFHGQIALTAAMDLVNRSHLTLVLAQDQPTQIPAKLYECMAMGVHTLVITEPTSAAAHEARRIGASTADATEIDRIADVIAAIWADPTTRSEPLVPLGYDALARRMSAVLRGEVDDRARLLQVSD